MLIGYIRVSTNDQNTDLQRKALMCAGCEQIFEDKMSGTKSERPGLKRALKCLKRGDTLVVWKLDRLGRRMKHGFAPIFPDICYHLTHYKPAAADIPVASDNPAHYADAIRYNARTPLQGSLLPLTRLVWA